MYRGKEFWGHVIGEDWYNLFPEFWDSEYMTQLLVYLSNRYEKVLVYPAKKDIFKAFKLCRVDKFKILILGQDPYPDGSATGLAFANRDDSIRLSPSLKKIFEAVEIDCYKGLKVDYDVTLESWAQDGVLLLNTALTVEKGKIGSHSDVWMTFTKSFLKRLSESHIIGLHVCLWGNHAKNFKQYLNPKTMNIYESTHPAHASYNNVAWKCDHFLKINKAIYEQTGIQEDIIAW